MTHENVKPGFWWHRTPASDWRVVEVCWFADIGLRYQRDGGWHELAGEFSACLRGESVNGELLDVLKRIAGHTDADDPNSYRSDDREGCLDTVHAIASTAVNRAESLPVVDPAHQERMRAALVACMAYIPCSEVHNWPPGFKLKDTAIKLARAALAESV